jgi:hypothetical protein
VQNASALIKNGQATTFIPKLCSPCGGQGARTSASNELANAQGEGEPKARRTRSRGVAYRSLQFELRHAELVSLLARHVQKLIRAFALGLDTETL